MESSLNEKKNFIRHVLLNSPPVKIADLVSDLKTLFGTSAAILNSIEEAVANHNEKSYALIPVADDEYVITCEEAKIDNSYIHPKLKSLLIVNHMKKNVNTMTSLEFLSYPELLENYRKKCSEKLEEYVQVHYSKWNELQTINYPTVNIKSKNGLNVKCSSSVYASENAGRFNLILIICCDRHYLKNFHASSWRSTWNVKFLTTDEEVLIRGTIDIVLTYFEDANINFKTSKSFEKTVQVNTDIDNFSTNILSSIKECENCTLYELNEFLINIGKNVVKNTRKIIPLNGDKFDWKETYQDIPAQIQLVHVHTLHMCESMYEFANIGYIKI
ncbi:F-actin capping protein, alpha subunit [Plasmodium gonderi]|uniref:F-actin-capping protein subunit alpha n=1 Tax=Plasmodium gonderi TaxID=77519 RepID=A0A1Y1JML4_PLAGO|nr:F-actin capping protein, alpha subunit [Plasmodium gonderi]GAW81274.1 F-actin capping protein, alpha subunit [Plasmodium gonderi]